MRLGGLPYLGIGKSSQNRPKSTKIGPRTAEKRLKRFAPVIKHDEAHHPHAFDHRGPWYHQRIAISAPTGPPVTRVLCTGNRLFLYLCISRHRQNPCKSAIGLWRVTRLIFKPMPPPGPTYGSGRHKCVPRASLAPWDRTWGGLWRSFESRNREIGPKLGQNWLKNAPETAEKRLKRSAHAIEHD